MIIGVTGKNCAGKDTVAEILQKKSFYHISLSDIIREDLATMGKPPTRENLIAHGNFLRTTHGPSILAQRALAKLSPDKHHVITSIRNPSEVDLLKQRKDFMLITVDAPLNVRYQRLISRGRKDETISSPKDLEKQESKEMSDNPNAQQLHKVIKMAHVTLNNETDVPTLKAKIENMLSKWSPKLQLPRPTWDAYFMSIAQQASSRSNCCKRKVAAIIIKDKRIISTGYNGTPRGVKNCNEGGCPRCNSFADSGSNLSECNCSHAEENAIVQASYHGVSLKDAIIYSTYSPCIQCTKMIINAGIKEVVYNQSYPLPDSAKTLFKEAGVKQRQAEL